MYSVRKVKTKSGSVAVQVVRYVGHRSVIAKHIGSGKDELEVTVLRQRAFGTNSPVIVIPVSKTKVLVV